MKVPGHGHIRKYSEDGQYTDAAAQSYKQGALVVLTNNEITECGADPASIFGYAAGPAGKHPEGPLVTTIGKLGSGQKAWFPVSAAVTVAANQDKSYGVVKDADGIWCVDIAETVNTRVFVHTVDEAKQMVLISVLVANRQVL